MEVEEGWRVGLDPSCEKRKNSVRSEESDSSGNLNVMMYLNKEEDCCGTRCKEFLEFVATSFDMGGSEPQPYFLENYN